LVSHTKGTAKTESVQEQGADKNRNHLDLHEST